MKKNILVLSGSKNSRSINYQLLNQLSDKHSELSVYDMRPLEIPIYSQDIEKTAGVPGPITDLVSRIEQADGLIIGTNEHNGYLSAFFKNILDWCSRAEKQFIGGKDVFLLSTSPGGRGGASALGHLSTLMGYYNGNIIHAVSIGSFFDHIDEQGNLKETPEMEDLQTKIKEFINA
jgi:NAD(P)H-dependent FMN reductase